MTREETRGRLRPEQINSDLTNSLNADDRNKILQNMQSQEQASSLGYYVTWEFEIYTG
jgi:hypothetical protein